MQPSPLTLLFVAATHTTQTNTGTNAVVAAMACLDLGVADLVAVRRLRGGDLPQVTPSSSASRRRPTKQQTPSRRMLPRHRPATCHCKISGNWRLPRNLSNRPSTLHHIHSPSSPRSPSHRTACSPETLGSRSGGRCLDRSTVKVAGPRIFFFFFFFFFFRRLTRLYPALRGYRVREDRRWT